MNLQNDRRFQELGVELVSVMVDPLPELEAEVQKYGITSPVASDGNRKVCGDYRVNCTAHMGKPGHTFVLVGKDGIFKWFRDYGGQMYVEVDEVYGEVAQRL